LNQPSSAAPLPFAVRWVVASVFIFTALELLIAVVLAPAVLASYLASTMVQLRIQVMMHLASFFLGGILVGVISPGVRLVEPAVGAFLSVLVTFMISIFLPVHWLQFDVGRLFWGGGIAFLLAIAGAYTGEKWMGNVEADDHQRRKQVRDRMWGAQGLLSGGDPRFKLPTSTSDTHHRG
jgi:peptidoglycan/LPS O-acetylase OafA/YrhL